MKRFKQALFSSVFTLAAGLSGAALAEPAVVASIKPVHSLASSIMQGVGTPTLILEGAGSPHTYALKPSQARQLQDADLVFWIGPDLEAFLEKPIETLGGNARAISLLETPGLALLSFREGGAFDAHDHEGHGDHDDHGHDDHAKHDDHDHDEHDHDEHAHGEKAHDDHGHDEHAHGEKAHDDHDHDDHAKHDDHDHDHDHDEHAHGEKAHDDHDHDEHAHDDHAHHGHDHGESDPHVWLDPANAKILARAMAAALSEADPANAATYAANLQALEADLDGLIAEVAADLAPVQGQPFVVFHDAYQYFERRFGMAATGSITVSPEVVPGAQRVGEIREKIQNLSAACVFSEPQFEPKLVSVVTEGTDAKTGVLDPLGAELQDGAGLYPALIRGMASSFRNCLSESS